MTIKIDFKILLIILLLTINSMFSQKSWTLDDCVAYALEHNLELNNLVYDMESDRETYKQAVRNLLPKVGLFSDYSIRYGRSVDPNDNTISDRDFFSNTYSLEASLDIFQGFQKINAIKASKLIYKATEEETLQQKYLLAFRVMQAFYDVQFLEGSLEIAREQEVISQSNYDLVTKQIELGLMAGADRFEAESLLLSDQLGVSQAKNQLDAAKLTLMQEMNLKGNFNSSFEIKKINEITISESNAVISDSIYGKAENFIPIIKAGELRVEAAKKQLAVERGSLYPSLSLFGGYGTGYFETIMDDAGTTIPFRNQFEDNAFKFIGVSLTIPITNGWATRSKMKQQKIIQLQAKNNLDIQKQELFQTIQSLVQEHNALQTEYEQTVKNARAQNQAFVIAQKRYEKGLISSIELFTAKNLFATAQNLKLQVGLRVKINKSTLDFYRGLPVFNIQNVHDINTPTGN